MVGVVLRNRVVGALRLAGIVTALALLAYGAVKLAEPGGGLLAHATYLVRVARQARCAPLATAPLGAPSALSACLTYNGDARRDLLEWVVHHRLHGVARFDVFWDVVGAYNATRHADFLAALQPLLHGAGGDVFAWSKADIGPLVERIAAATAAAAAARNSGGGACAPTSADLEDLAARARTCLAPGASWECQATVNAICLAAAKVRGDEWLGLFDVDEFFFAPGRPQRENACFWGGAPGHATDEGAAFVATPASCVVPVAEAPLLTGRDIASVLQRYSPLVSSVVVEGVVFGMVANHSREGLVLAAHGRAALMDAEGFLVPPPDFSRESCPDWFCGLMTPKKSFVRVAHAPVAGLRVHHHDTGPFAVERPARGAQLRLNHYAFDDRASVVRRQSTHRYFGNNIFKGLLENREGVADYMTAAADESGRALVPLVEHCMAPQHREEAMCRAPR